MEIYGKSITGRRETNQDSIFFNYYDGFFIMAIADGVGGNLGGDIASELTTSVCNTEFSKYVKNGKTNDLKSLINNIYKNSTIEINQIASKNDKLKNMATTLTIVVGYKDQFVVGNIGDSRTYLLKNHEMIQLTKDHSYIQEYKDKFPDMKMEPFVKSQLGHVITRSLNSDSEEIDIFPKEQEFFKLEKSELLLLCSDGFLPSKQFEKIFKLLKKSDTLPDFVNRITENAIDLGSKDNISVIVGCRENIFPI